MEKFLNAVKKIGAVLLKFAQAVLSAITAVIGQLNSAKLLITEIAGAGITLVGIGGLTSWQYALIIGGVAVILAIERQPSATEKTIVARATQLKAALKAAKASGTLNVMVDDILKVL